MPQAVCLCLCRVKLDVGKDYYFCTCGLSKNQPFCDGNHKGSKFTPMKFTATKQDNYLCQCKRSATLPHCDGTHQKIDFWTVIYPQSIHRLITKNIHSFFDLRRNTECTISKTEIVDSSWTIFWKKDNWHRFSFFDGKMNRIAPALQFSKNQITFFDIINKTSRKSICLHIINGFSS